MPINHLGWRDCQPKLPRTINGCLDLSCAVLLIAMAICLCLVNSQLNAERTQRQAELQHSYQGCKTAIATITQYEKK